MSIKTNKNYQKKTQREHILLRPDSYVGDIEPVNDYMWIYDNGMINQRINYVPGLYKIFDEVLVNARDHSINDITCDLIKVMVTNDYIEIYNNGEDGIPIEFDEKEKLWKPSLIFGELLTSSNFDDNEKRITGGRNGYGAKLANIFSKKFEVEIGDGEKKFYQVFENNMLEKTEPKITNKKGKSYCKITFYPDFEKFKIQELNNDMIKLFHKRIIDISATTNNKMKVYFNDEKIEIKDYKKYVDLYYPDDDKIEKIFLTPDPENRWEIAVIYHSDKKDHDENISYVNGICTYKGGTHLNYIQDQIIKKLINDVFNKKDKEIKITPALIKDHLIFYVNAIIENPSFTSQTKEALKTKITDFGCKYEVDDKMIKKIAKSGLENQVMQFAKFKENINLKKTDGKKVTKIKGLPKLEDANKAGTKESHKCCLILTEGDSAKALAMSAFSVIGRDYFGVFPLKGKLLNVRDTSVKKLNENEEIKNIKTILGLQQNTDYSNIDNLNTLRYGRILIFTDQDVDGSHIKGLLFNFFHFFWPSLVKMEGFLTSLTTPIVKARKGKEILNFYNLTEYQDWINQNNQGKGYEIKYYKGLGTSTSAEAKEYFQELEKKLVYYIYHTNTDDKLTLAFEKKRADDRKNWLASYHRDNILDNTNKKIQYEEFIDKELIHFSNEDNIRSIPSLVDGLKPSQRKILYGCFLRNLLKDQVKVAQLSGFVSDKACYHHGEMSLNGAIINMAQDYVGSNNINILEPEGQFGSRLKNGQDAASPRYIWTKINQLVKYIYREEDMPILNYQFEENIKIEPDYYLPIIPMILVNGTHGIGTGYSTLIPQFNPLEIANNMMNKLNNEKYKKMKPWYRYYTGTVEKNDKMSFIVKGKYSRKDNKIIIDELPIGESTSKYKEWLSDQCDIKNGLIKTFVDYNTDKLIKFEITCDEDLLDNVDIENAFKLNTKINLTNMHLFDRNHQIKKYTNVKQIMDEFYQIRIEYYHIRKSYLLNKYQDIIKTLSNKARFIKMIIDKQIIITQTPKNEIIAQLDKFNFDKNNDNYDYLLNMPLYSLSKEKVEQLMNELDEKQVLFNQLDEKNVEDLYRSDLDEFIQKYQEWFSVKEKDYLDEISQAEKKLIKKHSKKSSK